MVRFLATRLASAVAVLLAMSALVFWLGTLIPGDLVTMIMGSEGASKEQYLQLRHQLGLDQPVAFQYLHWLQNAAVGDFGKSPISGLYVSSEILRRLPVSLELALLALIGSILLGLPLGVFAASRHGQRSDLGVRTILLTLFSIPPFVAAVLLVLVGAIYLGPLYQVGFVPITKNAVQNLESLFLPTLSVAVPLAALTAQMTRSSLLEELSEPYVAMARAKGLSERRVLYVHALKNALPPVVTLQGYVFGSLIGGLIITEKVFNLPGLGTGLLTAIGQRDYPFVVAGTLTIAVIYVVVNFLVDVLYPILDPRQRP